MSQISCFDDLISKKLSEKPSNHPFMIQGTENGILLDTSRGKKFAYIDCINQMGDIGYQLVIIHVSNEGSQLVIRIKIATFNEETHSRKVRWQKAKQIKIKLSQNPNNNTFLLLQLSEWEQDYRIDRVFISIVDVDSLVGQEKVLFYKLNAKYSQIVKVDWHPYSECCLCVLYDKKELEVFNFVDYPQVAQLSANLKYVKSQYKSTRKLQFTDFTFCLGERNTQDLFTLYLQTKHGIIYAAYPFVVEKIRLTKSEYDNIRLNPQNSESLSGLWDILKQCTLKKSEQTHLYEVVYPEDPTKVSRAIRYAPINSYDDKNPSQVKEHQLFHRLVVQGVGQKKVLLQTGYSRMEQTNFLYTSLLPELFSSKQIFCYPLCYFYQSEKHNKDSLQLTLLNEYNWSSTECFYFCDGVNCYKFDFQRLFQILKTSDFSRLESQKPFDQTLIFSLPQKQDQEIRAMQLKDDKIILVRESSQGYKFDFINLYSLIVSDDVMGIHLRFDGLFKQIEEKRKQYRQSIKNGKTETNIADTPAIEFEQKSLDLVMKGIEQYTTSIKNKVNNEMSSMKITYEKLQTAIKKFNYQYQQRNRMNDLLKRAQDNNKKIQQLLENKSHDKSGFGKEPVVHRLEQKLLAIQNILRAVKEKRLNISPTDQSKYSGAVDKILDNLNSLKNQLHQLKQERN